MKCDDKAGNWEKHTVNVWHSTLQWRHNGRDGVSNHQPHDCLLNSLFGCRSKKTSKLRVTGLCVGNSPVTGEFPARRHCRRLQPIAIGYSRPSSWPERPHAVWRQRYQIMVVQALTEQIPEPIVFWFVIFRFVTKCVIHCMFELKDWRQRNARFFHLYENLKLQDRLINLTH